MHFRGAQLKWQGLEILRKIGIRRADLGNIHAEEIIGLEPLIRPKALAWLLCSSLRSGTPSVLQTQSCYRTSFRVARCL